MEEDIYNKISTLFDLYTSNDNCLSLLYPTISADYFKDKEIVFLFDDKANNIKITPYIKRRELGGDSDDLRDIGGRHKAWEIGLKFNF